MSEGGDRVCYKTKQTLLKQPKATLLMSEKGFLGFLRNRIFLETFFLGWYWSLEWVSDRLGLNTFYYRELVICLMFRGFHRGAEKKSDIRHDHVIASSILPQLPFNCFKLSFVDPSAYLLFILQVYNQQNSFIYITCTKS